MNAKELEEIKSTCKTMEEYIQRLLEKAIGEIEERHQATFDKFSVKPKADSGYIDEVSTTEIIHLLSEIRRMGNISLTEIAQETGLAVPQVSQLLPSRTGVLGTKTKRMTRKTAIKLCAYLERAYKQDRENLICRVLEMLPLEMKSFMEELEYHVHQLLPTTAC